VKKPVGEHLHAQILHRFGCHAAEKMVPLQYLVQKDAIEETAQRKADQQRGSRQALLHAGLRSGWILHGGLLVSTAAVPGALVFMRASACAVNPP
jgi:hypothetical protein